MLRRVLLHSLGFITLGLLILMFVWSILSPYMGIAAEKQGDSWLVNVVDSWGTAYKSGIRPGDVLLEIDGLAVSQYAAGRAYLRPERIDRLLFVDAAGTHKSVSLAGISPGPETSYGPVSLFILGLLFWGLGSYVYFRRPDRKPAVLLHFLGLATSVALMGVASSGRGVVASLPLQVIMFSVIPGLFVHLFLVFPTDKLTSPRARKVVPLIYASGAILVLYYVAYGRAEQIFYPFFRSILIFHLALGLPAGAGVLLYTYVTTTSPAAKSQLKIVVTGTALGVVPFVLLSALPEVFLGRVLVIPQLTILAALLVPLSLGYAIVRHHLIDIDFYISRALVYALLTGIMVSTYLIATLALARGFGSVDDVSRIAMVIALSALVAMFFVPVRTRIQEAVDRWLFKEQQQYKRALTSVAGALFSYEDVDSMARLVVETISRAMQLSGCSLLVANERDGLEISAATGNLADPAVSNDIIDGGRQLMLQDAKLLRRGDLNIVDWLVRLSLQGKDVGVLVLGPKLSQRTFNADEMAFLSSFASQVAMALENALLLSVVRAQRDELGHTYEQLSQYATSLEQRNIDLQSAYLGLTQALVAAIDANDPQMQGHSERVAFLSRRIAAELGLSAEQVRMMEIGGRLHDIENVQIPEGTLLKPSPSGSASAYRAGDILRFLPFLESVVPAIERRREWYRYGKQQDSAKPALPVGARILAVADTYDKMTSASDGGMPISHERALELLRKGSGLVWDPEVVDALARTLGDTETGGTCGRFPDRSDSS